MLNQLKSLYKKLGASSGLLSGLHAHDEQIAQLRAEIATLLAQKSGLTAAEQAKAKAEIEGLLAYQAVSREETERLRALYESAAARLSAMEAEVETLRQKLSAGSKDVRGRP